MGFLSTSYSYCFDKEHVKVMDHPATDLILSRLRNKNSTNEEFVAASSRLMRLLLEYALGFEPMIKTTQQTPTNTAYDHYELEYGKNYCVVMILRAGNCMVNEVLHVMPGISTGFVLVQRDESTEEKTPIYYYSKFPKDISSRRVILVDPMLGTGGSAITAIRSIIENGVKEENIVFINLLGHAGGIQRVLTLFPKISIITAKIDPIMNEHKYLCPGVGDFGDRYYNTV